MPLYPGLGYAFGMQGALQGLTKTPKFSDLSLIKQALQGGIGKNIQAGPKPSAGPQTGPTQIQPPSFSATPGTGMSVLPNVGLPQGAGMQTLPNIGATPDAGMMQPLSGYQEGGGLPSGTYTFDQPLPSVNYPDVGNLGRKGWAQNLFPDQGQSDTTNGTDGSSPPSPYTPPQTPADATKTYSPTEAATRLALALNTPQQKPYNWLQVASNIGNQWLKMRELARYGQMERDITGQKVSGAKEQPAGMGGSANYFGSPSASAAGIGGPPGANITTVNTAGGPINVHSAAANDMQGFVNDLVAAGAPVGDIGSYNKRRIAGSSQWSQHAYGGALDLGNQSGRNVTSPEFLKWYQGNRQVWNDLLKKYNMVGGESWRHPDFGHVEWRGPAQRPVPPTRLAANTSEE